MAAYAHHSMNLGFEDDEVTGWFYKGLSEINKEHSPEEWLDLIMEFGNVNLKCMELLDTANTESFGNPVPTRVNTRYKKRSFYCNIWSRFRRFTAVTSTDRGQRYKHIYP